MAFILSPLCLIYRPILRRALAPRCMQMTVPIELGMPPRCVMRIEVLNTTRSAGHKFKISELAIVARHLTAGDAQIGRPAQRRHALVISAV